MIFDIEMLKKFYASFGSRVERSKQSVGKSMTLAEKILYAHLFNQEDLKSFKRGIPTRSCCNAGCHSSNGLAAVYERR